MQHVHARRFYGRLQVAVTQDVPGTEQCRFAKPLEFEEEPSSYPSSPMLELEEQEGQRLLDQLWVEGFRPSVGVASAGALEAAQAHIADLREVNRALLGALLQSRQVPA